MSVNPAGLRSLVVGTTPTRSKIALTAPSGGPVLSQIGITVPYIGPDAVSVQYTTLPGNRPKTNSNFLAIWESTIVPWTVPPMAMQKIIGDTEQGSVSFSDLSIQNKAYIIGYAAGPDITDICATATVFVGGQPAQYFSTSIGIASVLSDTIVLSYSCCLGYQPQPSNNWVGLWKGAASPYYSGSPQYKTDVTSSSAQGTVVMNGLTLAFGTPYTLAYFMGPNVTDAAAILTFTTSS
ncbi:hypothetical protein [Bradyrhizobium sp.]|jgi:hypothetical protein|uniref:hypothetical protein n=1 Tax=Bradyrhizobium sp. TaxID=376 RepID=UPI002DF820F6|nr:hypothetical protein [Bradyrhizobium sp.]